MPSPLDFLWAGVVLVLLGRGYVLVQLTEPILSISR